MWTNSTKFAFMISIKTGLKDYEVLLGVGISSNERKLKCKVRVNFTIECDRQNIPATLSDSIDYALLKNCIDKTKNIELELLEQFADLWLSDAEITFTNLKSIFISLEKIDAPIDGLNKGIPFVSVSKRF